MQPRIGAWVRPCGFCSRCLAGPRPVAVGAVSRVFCGCLLFEALKFVRFRGLDPARDFEPVCHCRLALMTSNYRHIDSVTLGRQIWCRADVNNLRLAHSKVELVISKAAADGSLSTVSDR